MSENLEKNKEQKENIKDNKNEKISFFKKVWYSTTKIEKYSELSAQGLGKSLKYLLQLILIFSIILSIVFIYKANVQMKGIAQYINDNIPNFTYTNEALKTETEEIIKQENENFGKIIIDTTVEDENKINEYLNEIPEDKSGVIVLKNKLILKEIGMSQTYQYKEILSSLNISEFNKQQLVEYLSNFNMMLPLYMNFFIIMLISQIISLLATTLLYIVLISVFGYITTIMLKLKIRYVAVFNMAVYSMTLSTVLYILYLLLNLLFGFIINYFDVMYILLAAIYMIASIFMIKIDFNKKQGEVQKVIEVEKQIREESEENTKDNKKDKDNKEKKKKTKEKEDKESNTNGEEPEGSNA